LITKGPKEKFVKYFAEYTSTIDLKETYIQECLIPSLFGEDLYIYVQKIGFYVYILKKYFFSFFIFLAVVVSERAQELIVDQ
jgi:hypothetical protein